MTLATSNLRQAAHACGFVLVGLAKAEPLDPEPLQRWLNSGYAAKFFAMRRRIAERLDPSVVVPGAKTVIVLGIPYGKGVSDMVSGGTIARYAQGRDYHYAHRDRMRALRKQLLTLVPKVRTYACVDAGAAMEKAWAEKAGLGFIGKNGVVISRSHGSWFTLSLMIIDRAVDRYDEPQPRLCGTCDKCLVACPTNAFPSPGVLDARRCISYHTVENHQEVPLELRDRMGQHVFGCDACQEVCPFNRDDLPDGDPRQVARPIGHMEAAEIAALSQEQFAELVTGTPLRRIGYHGLRRNACLSLGARRERSALPLLERLAVDPNSLVREAADWALRKIQDG
jgi:epoxyqueuosine reductase